jgi:hypothetical protein
MNAMAELVRSHHSKNSMRYLCLIAASLVLAIAGCKEKALDESAYVLLRDPTPGFRAYFMGEGAYLNGLSCREIMGLANEAVDERRSRGESTLNRYECVSLKEALERGVK